MGLPLNISPYRRVYVLAIHWSNAQMGVVAAEDDLCDIFAITYGYTVEKHCIDATIPQYDARKEFRKRLDKFTDECNERGNLLIVVYSGYATYRDIGRQYLLSGTPINHVEVSERHTLGWNLDWNLNGTDLTNDREELLEPTLDWSRTAAGYFHGTDADVLTIFDCCYASTRSVERTTDPEVLAASRCNSTIAGNVLSTSLTRDLIRELKLLNGNPASVTSICARIRGNTQLNVDIETHPLHIPRIGRDSIVLSRLWYVK